MKKILLILSMFVTLIFIACAEKDYFKNPSLIKEGDAPLYRINFNNTKFPAFVKLPSENKNIELLLEKAGAKPIEFNLDLTIDGWKTPNGKIISTTKNDAGIVVDFANGKVYEMPKADLEKLLKTFTPEQETFTRETYTEAEGFVPRLVISDSADSFNKEELRHLNLLNARNKPTKTNILEDTPVLTKPEDKKILSKDTIYYGKPIINAALNDQYDQLMKLLAQKGNINELDDADSENALMKTIRANNENMANLLIDKGINLKQTNRFGQNALHLSSDAGLYNISKRLIDSGISPNSKDNAGNTPLIYAATSPNANMIDLLAGKGARIDEANKEGQTPLALASWAGNTKNVENLVKKGADINAKDANGNDILMQSVKGNNEYTVQKLLSLGANADTPNKNGIHPLHVAIKDGNNKIAEELMQKGADINAQDEGGNTPLMLAAATGNTPLVEKILSYKPDLLIKNNIHKNAYAVAQDKNAQQIMRLINNSMSKLDTATLNLFERVAANDVEGVEKAVKSGARVNSTEMTTGNTPLFTAVANNYKFMASKLIELGADVNKKNDKGNIPLVIAVTAADPEMVEILLKAKSDFDARNKNGDTALIWAVKLKRTDIVKALLRYGASPNIKNNDGVSAYLIAYNEGTPEILSLLQTFGGHR